MQILSVFKNVFIVSLLTDLERNTTQNNFKASILNSSAEIQPYSFLRTDINANNCRQGMGKDLVPNSATL